MKLEKRVSKDWDSIQTRASAMFAYYSFGIGKMIEQAQSDIIGSIAASLSMYQTISYTNLKTNHVIDRLSALIHHRLNNLAVELEQYWGEKRDNFDLFSRLSINFVSTKTSPPWVKKNLDLKSELSTEGRFDPRMGHIRFYFQKMADAIIQQISQGALQEETINQILTRIRNMFNRREKKGVREEEFNPNQYTHNVDVSPDGEYSESLRGVVDIEEGTYTLEDVARLQDEQRKIMRWDHRSHRTWFSDEIKRNNRYLRDLEQVLMSDAINQMHEGQLQQMMGYPEEMGIEDFVWVVSRPQPKCDECTKRDGLTMKEIKKKIKDEFGDLPPPLHPNCRCQLAPKIKDDWADNVLKKEGIEWDQETGIVYNADDQERDSGISDMTLDDYLKLIPRA